MHPGRPSIARRFSAPALLVLYGALAAGGVWEHPADYRWWHVLLAAGFFPLAVLLALGARNRLSQSRALPLSWGAAVLILAHSAVQATGGADFSPLGPSLYLLLALLASLQSLPLALFNTLLCG
ncbi:MAG: hypothetical protein AB1405_01755, partial [Bdellovibrionota bacterium]